MSRASFTGCVTDCHERREVEQRQRQVKPVSFIKQLVTNKYKYNQQSLGSLSLPLLSLTLGVSSMEYLFASNHNTKTISFWANEARISNMMWSIVIFFSPGSLLWMGTWPRLSSRNGLYIFQSGTISRSFFFCFFLSLRLTICPINKTRESWVIPINILWVVNYAF